MADKRAPKDRTPELSRLLRKRGEAFPWPMDSWQALLAEGLLRGNKRAAAKARREQKP